MVDLMWKKCSKSSEEERRKKGQLKLCISGGSGNGCGGSVSISASTPVGFFFCCVFCLVCQFLLTGDCPGHNPQWTSPQWSSPKWKSSPCCSRSLSEVVLRSLEKYIDLNDIKLLETKRHLRAPPISGTPKKEEKIKSLRKEHERSTNEEGNDVWGIASSDAGVEVYAGVEAYVEVEEEDDENKIDSELPYEDLLGEELTEQQFDKMVGKLRGYIDIKDMNALWNYVHTNGKKKYFSLKEELWKDCENMSIKYNIPEEFTIKEWRKAYLHLKDELLKKERDDYMDLKVFIDAGFNVRWEYIAFIIDKYESWDAFIDTARDNWKKSLSKSFEKYVEDAQEKEIEKNPKTGAKVSCINKYNEENKIMVSEILL
ncbi:phist protein [Plasmodium cynomolgi strain B]|uniref:Phist protein n=1 Tax=Plasmodium cynomolgi (strain B) TaxID=1120755 RepID=K6UIV5_PLACD|nr:phist protein [Plasmodium cynomolgi strain B]GAB65378.1 phist protein [Plasmodium cynomolgi strain B]